MVLFFLIERLLHWHHCHDGKCEVHPVSYLILIGDGVHNFIDGMIIGVIFGVIAILLGYLAKKEGDTYGTYGIYLGILVIIIALITILLTTVTSVETGYY